MATVLILEPIFEADFLDCSKGFRAGRGTHDATEQIVKNLKAGFCEVYDADLEGYFDSIPHDKLDAAMRVVDGSVLRLIRRWLEAPAVEEDPRTGRKRPPRKPPSDSAGKGTPQGGVISPLLANIYLHWFDKFFHQRQGPRQWANTWLVRYADDFVVMARYQGQADSGLDRGHTGSAYGPENQPGKDPSGQAQDPGRGPELSWLSLSEESLSVEEGTLVLPPAPLTEKSAEGTRLASEPDRQRN